MNPLPRWITILRRTLLGAAIVATVVAAVVVEEDIRGERAWERFKAERAATGRSLDPADYREPEVPERENLFKAPVLARFFEPDGSWGRAWNAFSQRYELPWETWPTYGQWQTGKPTDFKAYYRLVQHLSPDAPVPSNPPEAEFALRRLDPIKADLDTLDAAALARPRTEIFGVQSDGALVPKSIAALKGLVQVLSWRASAELALDLHQEAFADTYTALRLINGGLRYPTMVHDMIACAMAPRAVQPLWEGCLRHGWSRPQLEQLEAAAVVIQSYGDVAAVVDRNQAGLADFYADPSSRPFWMPLGWRKLSEIAGLDLGTLDLARAANPADAMDAATLSSLAVFPEGRRHSLPAILWGAGNNWFYQGLVTTLISGQTALRLAHAACALERFRMDRGHYPANLAALVPTYLDRVPADFIDGRPLRYAVAADDTYRLYSIGLNGIDEGGTLPSRKVTYGWNDKDGGGDWAWPSRAVP